jgi:uncharacterized membrane protein
MNTFWIVVAILLGITLVGYLIVGAIAMWLIQALYEDQYENKTGQRKP